MTPIKEQKVYLPVSVKKRRPEKDGFYYVIFKNGDEGNDWYKDGQWFSEEQTAHPNEVTHYLKEQSLFVLDRGEMEELLKDVFDHAIEWNDLEQSARVQGGYKKNYIENKEEYIKKILP